MSTTNTPESFRGIKVPPHLANRAFHPEYAMWKLAVTGLLDTVIPLLEPFEDDEPCRFDHHGYCQEHGSFGEGPCATAAVKEFLDRARHAEYVWQFGGMEWCHSHRPRGVDAHLLTTTEALKDRTWSSCVQCGRELISCD